jgi:integration host factor subunit alpha
VPRSKLAWSGQTATRATLSNAVQRAAGLPTAQAKALVDQVLEEIAATLERGETVKLSSFGLFVVRRMTERIA